MPAMERKINPQEATSRCEFHHGGEHQQIIIIQVTIVMRHKEQSAQNVTTITGIHAYCSFKKNKRAFWLSLMTTLMTTPHTETSECRRRAHPNFAQHPRFGPVVVDRKEHRIFDLQKVSIDLLILTFSKSLLLNFELSRTSTANLTFNRVLHKLFETRIKFRQTARNDAILISGAGCAAVS